MASLHELIRGAAFDPETTALLGDAYDRAVGHIGREQPTELLETLARHIIEAGRRGVRDVEKIVAFALSGLDRFPDAG